MEASRLDRVQVDVAGEIVEINWHERDVLCIEELAFIEGTMAIRERFEAVGASRPVELDAEQRARLRTALEWGEDRLQPEGTPREKKIGRGDLFVSHRGRYPSSER